MGDQQTTANVSRDKSQGKKVNFDESKKEESESGWNGVQLLSTQDAKDELFLDTGSSLTLFKDQELVANIRTAKSHMAMTTNAGQSRITQEGYAPGIGKVWYDPNAVANIISFAELVKKYRITYDSYDKDAFTVHVKGRPVKFRKTLSGLYGIVVEPEYKAKVELLNQLQGTINVQTVKENTEGFTPRQVKQAREARRLYHTVGAPSVEKLRMVIKMNTIRNCPVTMENITMADKIFGLDIATLKGKSTRTKPELIVSDEIEVPEEIYTINRSVEPCIDIMFVNQMPMLTSIDTTVRFRALIPLKDQIEEIHCGVSIIIRKYNKAGFIIRKIHCDVSLLH